MINVCCKKGLKVRHAFNPFLWEYHMYNGPQMRAIVLQFYHQQSVC
jgi:hypothetical protein